MTQMKVEKHVWPSPDATDDKMVRQSMNLFRKRNPLDDDNGSDWSIKRKSICESPSL